MISNSYVKLQVMTCNLLFYIRLFFTSLSNILCLSLMNDNTFLGFIKSLHLIFLFLPQYLIMKSFLILKYSKNPSKIILEIKT